MLELEAVETAYGTSQVLFGVTLAVGAGEVITLLGRNGMGKTTTVRTIMGLVPPRAGRIRFEGRAIERWPDYRIAQAGLGFVPEGRQIFPNLTVRENLVATAANRRRATEPWTLLLILDEATEGLAPLVRVEIWRCLAMLKAAGQAILVIDKNVEALGRIADRHYMIEKGRVVWSGDAAALRAASDVQLRYLGVSRRGP
jgi:branched-chain amino acid transport system ATP-binding protein